MHYIRLNFNDLHPKKSVKINQPCLCNCISIKPLRKTTINNSNGMLSNYLIKLFEHSKIKIFLLNKNSL